MTLDKINNLTATEACHKIEVIKESIRKANEYLKWNFDSSIAPEIRESKTKREIELPLIQARLDHLFESQF